MMQQSDAHYVARFVDKLEEYCFKVKREDGKVKFGNFNLGEGIYVELDSFMDRDDDLWNFKEWHRFLIEKAAEDASRGHMRKVIVKCIHEKERNEERIIKPATVAIAVE